jgi:hypothetical protein
MATTYTYGQWGQSGPDIFNTNFLHGRVGLGTDQPTVKNHAFSWISGNVPAPLGGPGPVACGSVAFRVTGGLANFQIPCPDCWYPFDEDQCWPFKNIFEVERVMSTTSQIRLLVDWQGRVGIGNTITPTQDLDVEGNIRMRSGAQTGYIPVSSSDGTMIWTSPSALSGGLWVEDVQQTAIGGAPIIRNAVNREVHIGNQPYSLFFHPNLGGGYYSNLSVEGDAGIFFKNKTAEGPGSTPGLVIAPARANKDGLRISWDGNVAIGDDQYATKHAGYKLAVKGNIIAELVRVKLHQDWPDYVFQPGYKLRSLQELETYIAQHKHLPDVPPAEEMAKKGQDLGEMNMILLQKVEELTLYVIELQKEVDELRKTEGAKY